MKKNTHASWQSCELEYDLGPVCPADEKCFSQEHHLFSEKLSFFPFFFFLLQAVYNLLKNTA